MHLDVDGQLLAVNQLGLDFAVVETTGTYPPGPAKLSVLVDNSSTVRLVFLPDGIRPGPGRTRLLLD